MSTNAGSEPVGRTAVLLGAGASKNAGLPLTNKLARELVRSFDRDLELADKNSIVELEPIVRALRVVYGAMVQHGTEQGLSPLASVNVEKLVSAVRLLAARSEHEAAPFVSWRPAIEEVDRHSHPDRDSELAKTVYLNSRLRVTLTGLAEKMEEIAKEVVGPGDGAIFRELEGRILRRIRNLLESPTRLRYLRPLIDLALRQDGGLDVTTLNYDLTVEMIAGQYEVDVDTGLSRGPWAPGQPLEFERVDGRINLIKPHGSINWVRISQPDRVQNNPFVRFRCEVRSPPTPGDRHAPDPDPLIVIGDRAKLEAEGPTLALMRAFEESLRHASNLVVVGYSFSDDHINAVVQDWLAQDSARTIAVLDPSWPVPEPDNDVAIDPPYNLKERLRRVAAGGSEGGEGRIVVVPCSARKGLAQVLAARPLENIPASLSMSDEGDRVRLTNHGYDLDYLKFDAWNRVRQHPGFPPDASHKLALRLQPSDDGAASILIPRLAHGETIDVFFNRPQGTESASVRAVGHSWARWVFAEVEITPTGTVVS